jgi:hypothetical protein
VLAQIVATLPPSSGENLLGFHMDASLYFCRKREFWDAVVKRTDDPACPIRANLLLRDEVSTVQEVSLALRDVCQSLMYSHFAACSVNWYREATCLRFVTVIDGNQFHVTGTALAHGPRYPELVAAFDRDFGQHGGPLRPMPGGLPSWAPA